MAELISAEEARKKIAGFETEAGEEAKEKLVSSINKAVQEGKNCVWISAPWNIMEIMKKLAEKEGYKVTVFQDQRDGNTIKVEW